MKIGKLEGESSIVTLQNFLQSYRATPHSTTGSTPAELFLKRRIRTKWDLIKPDLKAKVEEKQGRQKENHDKRAKCRQFLAHQMVIVRDYRRGNSKWAHGVIQEVIGSRSYLVQLQDGTMVKRHADQMQLFVPHRQIEGPEIEGVDTKISEEEIDLGNDAGRESPEQRVGDQNIVDNENGNGMDTSTSLVPPTIGESQSRRYPSRNRRLPDRFFMITSK